MPEQFTESILSHAAKTNLKINILDETELKQKKFGALLAVAEGSKSKPSLICLEYSPKKFKKTIVLVGKGVTFDSGGINLNTRCLFPSKPFSFTVSKTFLNVLS